MNDVFLFILYLYHSVKHLFSSRYIHMPGMLTCPPFVKLSRAVMNCRRGRLSIVLFIEHKHNQASSMQVVGIFGVGECWLHKKSAKVVIDVWH